MLAYAHSGLFTRALRALSCVATQLCSACSPLSHFLIVSAGGQTAEIKNGRLAMIGFSGMLHHALITHKGPIDQIMSADFVSTPSRVSPPHVTLLPHVPPASLPPAYFFVALFL